MAGRPLSDADWARRLAGEPFAGVLAVVTTGIVCRSTCPARPQRRNIRHYDSLAGALADGFRPCKRCRPERTPGFTDTRSGN